MATSLLNLHCTEMEVNAKDGQVSGGVVSLNIVGDDHKAQCATKRQG